MRHSWRRHLGARPGPQVGRTVAGRVAPQVQATQRRERHLGDALPDARRPCRGAHERDEDHPLAKARDQARAGCAEHEARHEVAVLAPQQLRDRSAHRVADGDHRACVEVTKQRGGVVGAVAQLEPLRRADAAPVAAQVGRDHVEVLRERREHVVPVEAAARDPTVQQQHRWCAGRTRHLAHEHRAAARELDPSPHRERRRTQRSHPPCRPAHPRRSSPSPSVQYDTASDHDLDNSDTVRGCRASMRSPRVPSTSGSISPRSTRSSRVRIARSTAGCCRRASSRSPSDGELVLFESLGDATA